jgi:hypothetical protein
VHHECLPIRAPALLHHGTLLRHPRRASLLYGAGILPLGARGWLWIGAALIVETALLTIVPERIWGRYSRGHEERCC